MEKIQLFYAHHRKREDISVIRQMVPHVSETLSVIRTKALAFSKINRGGFIPDRI
jgi:hypothetical protein